MEKMQRRLFGSADEWFSESERVLLIWVMVEYGVDLDKHSFDKRFLIFRI